MSNNRPIKVIKEKEKEMKEDDEKRESLEKELRGPGESVFIKSQREMKHQRIEMDKLVLGNISRTGGDHAKTKSTSTEQKYITPENYIKLDYSQLDPVKNELYAMMKGKYSSLRKGIAYINPKVNEPHDMIAGRPPRKVMIDRMKKVYSTINIEALLSKVAIDYSKKDQLEDWLPLEFFEDKDLDIYTPQEWVSKAMDPSSGEVLFIPGVGLKFDEKGIGTWKRVLINNYNFPKQKFEGIWDGTEDKCELSKIYLLFDAENPYLFCKKVSLAHSEREKAESIIRYNFYIDKMTSEFLSEINDVTKSRLRKGLERISDLKLDQKSFEELFKELNYNFQRTTNKIIFDKFYYSKLNNSLIITDLNLPNKIINNPEINIKEVRYLGLENVPNYNYIESYKNFTFKTLLCRKEIIDCLQKIKDECNKIRNNFSIFSLDIIKKPLRLQVFKQIQGSAIKYIFKKLETDWITIIKDTLEKSLTGVGKGSFNLNVASKEIYEYLKLKKYMTVVKLLMQDTLYYIVTKSMTGYVEFFEKFIPDEVIIEDVNKVTNIFPGKVEEDVLNTTNDLISSNTNNNASKLNENTDNEEDDFLIDPDTKWPLFQINIARKDDRSVGYTITATELINDVLKIFDDGLEKMQQIPQVEPLLLSNLIKKAENQRISLKSVAKPKGGKPSPIEPEQIKNGYELNDDAIWIWDLYLRLNSGLEKACEPLNRYLETFKKYSADLAIEPNDYVRKITNDKAADYWTNQKIKEDIVANKEKEQIILKEIPQIIHVSFFQINCKEFRTDLANKFAKIADLEVEILKDKAAEISTGVINGYNILKNKISREIITIADLVAVQSDIESLDLEIQKLKEKSAEIDEIYNILETFYTISDTIQFDNRQLILGNPTDIENTKRMINIVLDKKKDKLYEEQIENQNKLIEEVNELSSNIDNFVHYFNEDQLKEATDLSEYVHDKLKEYMSKAQMYNERENLFNKPRTDYSKIQELKQQFDPFYWLWMSIKTWKRETKSWFEDNFSKLKGEDVDTTVTDVSKDLKNAIFKFREREVDYRIVELANKYKGEVDQFKPKADLALAITRKGLEHRHWVELFEKTNIDCTPRDNFTFKNIIDLDMIKFLDVCQDVGEKAFREYKIEEQMNEIDLRWRDIFFTLVQHKTTKVGSISNWNDINKDLDNDIMELQQLGVSPYKGPFTEKISAWTKDLLNINNVLEEWNKCQKSWIYLQPVFDSGDIAKDIPHEHKKFMMTDRMWKDLMASVEKPPPQTVKQNCCREGLLEKLKEANMNLENVEKGLNAYMEKKRAFFPRFFFISNSQFLEILSQTKDIKKVKDNLGKIFESIDNIVLKEDKYIISFMSRLGENFILEDEILIHGKNVEIWMKNLEVNMFKTIRAYLHRGIKDYLIRPRKDWATLHPGQVVMHGNQIGWTREVEDAIEKNALVEYVKEYDRRILGLVDIVREKQTRLMSINLSNLITIDVHNKNVMAELLKNQVTTTSAFEWIMQLRYYWEDYMDPILSKVEEQCIVKSVQTDFPYGYEYIGNAEILVITPLTDKCYLTLMGALRLNLGGAPAGPAGTGKTESTKDLARCLAKLCIVYNCSEDTDYIMIAKFFKGLAFCGAWICFDEFNRINIEVLSVIAQQLLQLFGAKERNIHEIEFDGTRIDILPTFCVFITMNPGYAGRTELPDNLKALFRPIAMMVPDYRLIAEINLYSAGYVKASDLATKVVSTMKLSSEQLSTQGHYDFGMRAVKSVLNAARRLKRTEVDTDESQLLLRALEDVNVPKFLADDIDLFKNIISDLFPQVQRPKIDYSDLYDKINIVCQNSNILPTDSFKMKIIQLYDTLQVRHGLMIVGPAGGGKTSNYTVLKQSLSMLEDGKTYFKTHSFVINPKAIRHAEIYSEQDLNSMEWSFGVLPLIINDCKKDTSGRNKYWIIFDGPVDAMWIEDMNSVLDDSKKLCLASSDIILLNEFITIMFEVEDLVVASPATVSRCGMVYMEPNALGLDPLVKCWLNKLPDAFLTNENKVSQILYKLFSSYLDECTNFVRKRLKEPCPTVNNSLAKSVMKIIDCFFEKFNTPEAKFKKMTDEAKQIEAIIEGIFYYACVWGLGITTNDEGRKKFNEFFREQMKLKAIDPKFAMPDSGSVYDYLFDAEKAIWVPWLEILGGFDVPQNALYTEIIVPTPDSIRYFHLIKQLVRNGKCVITTGPTGTGKTINMMEILSRGLTDKYTSIIINFSAQTTARQTQDALMDKLKPVGRGRYAPDGNKTGTVFVDDLNMPIRQDSGAQPPIELLRQWLDHKGWYDLKNKNLISVENLVLLGAMGVPGGGRNLLSQRFQRHFNLITYNELEDNSIFIIFNSIVKYFLRNFPEEIKSQIDKIVKSTLGLYKEIKAQMLPTPQQMHYIFNLRDMSKVLQGVSSLSIKNASKSIDIVRIWMHEMTRVFGDRLISEEDREWLKNRINKDAKDVFTQDIGEIYTYGKKLIFCDFLSNDSFNRNYVQVTNFNQFIKRINTYLDEYNENSKKKQLKLVMFLDACDHVSRICRIIRQPQGNALLLGVGGSGRQSLAKLATFINSFECYQIDVIKGYGMIDFTKNVKDCLMQAGGKKETPTTFLIVDTQLVFPMMLEYINNILNSGDVPNIYKKDDMDQITDGIRNEVLAKYGNLVESSVMKTYVARVLKNIHMVIAMSPMGNSFVQRLRMFPSLVNCCTLDWFNEWPEDALESVAMDVFKKDPMELDQYIPGIVQAFKFIHKRVESMSKEFSNQMKRYIYLTPTSYLELLNMYQKILKIKREEYFQAIRRLDNGLNVLSEAEKEVGKMQKQIEEQTPLLLENERKTNEMVVDLKRESAIASAEEKIASEKEAEALKLDAECTKIFSEAEAELEKVKPLIETARSSIKKVTAGDLREQANFRVLPPGAEKLIEGLLIFKKGEDWKKKDYKSKLDSTTAKNAYDIKTAAFKEINFADYETVLADLKSFCESEETLEPLKTTYKKNMDLLEIHFVEKEVTAAACEKSCKTLMGLFYFLEALMKYVKDSIEKIDPVKKLLGRAIIEKAEAEEKKTTAVRKKEAAQKIVETLKTQYETAVSTARMLSENLQKSKEKLERAKELIGLLLGEKDRWSQTVKDLKVKMNNLIGDCLVAAGAISYNGPFTYYYRVKLEEDWRKKISELGVIHTTGATMKAILEDKIESREWTVNGLPQDNLSIENGIIIKNTRRWPLMVDPQNQGSTFIKKLGKRKEILDVVKASDPNVLNGMIGALNAKRWLLLENVGINIDPSLDPVLNQQVTERGGFKEIKIGERTIPWSDEFKLYISTTIPNPHFSPETFVKFTIINFGITPQGLEEQMMTLLINNEMPDLEQRKNAILMDNFNSMFELRKTEDNILNDLTANDGGIDQFLESNVMITSLKEAKTKSEEISQKIAEGEETSKQIDIKRELYRPAAFRSSLLFFATIDLSSIDPMYQFSLQWFAKLYEQSFKISPLSSNIDIRINNLNKTFTKILFENVCRSLFEKDKLLFSFVICHKILTGEFKDTKIKPDQWRYFLAGPSGDIEIAKNPTDWISKNEWHTFYRQLKYMNDKFVETNGLEPYFMKNSDKLKVIYDSLNAHTEVLPDIWEEKIPEFLKLCILKMIRPDKLIAGLQLWIERNLGKEFVEPPAFSMHKSYKESSNIVPLIFILSPGSDPINDITAFAEEQGYSKKFEYVSLGRGQEKRALNQLEESRIKGGWVLLQNCHLAKSFMGKLEEIVENFDTNWPDKDFRLWLTSMSNENFPVSILQNSVKITVEPPKGLKNNLLRNYNKLENKDLEDCTKKDEFKALLFGLSFFHAIVQDRRKYGPIGWNVKYDFTNEDWMVCKKQIKIFLEQYDGIPYQVLDYLLGDINYGGRVTDDKDQRLIKNILKTYLTDKIFNYSDYKFSKSGSYYCPEPGEQENYMNYIVSLPVNSEPEVFGLHENADIVTAQNECYALLETVLSIQPRLSGSAGKSPESMIIEILDEIEKKRPQVFDMDEIKKNFPTDYNESMNTVLSQEIIRYNNLLNIMKKSIKTLKKALTGKIVMSDDTEKMSKSLFINQVPVMWSGVFLSLKPLSSWINDLNERITFFGNWVKSGRTPYTFWISGFSFPQAFLTAALQNHARKSGVAIDLLSFEFKIDDKLKPSDIKQKPEIGLYVYGMFLEGAKWNYDTHILDDSSPKELYTDVPMIQFVPVKNRIAPKSNFYNCPLYKVLSRAGTLSTTGHSTNYVLFVEIPSDREQNVWVKAGVAMFLALKQ